MRWQGFVLGVLALTALDLVIGTRQGVASAGGLAKGAGGLIRRFVDAGIPAFESTAGAQFTPQLPQFDPNTGRSIPGTGVAPGLGTGPGGLGLGTGNAPGYQPPNGLFQT